MDINKGYTLIEMLVGISVFVILIAAPTGFFVSSLRAQQKSLYTQELLDNTSYLLEYMSRTIRMAKKDDTGMCIGRNLNYELTWGGNGIKFRNYQDLCQEFYWDSGAKKLIEIKGSTMHGLNPTNLSIIDFKIGPADSWDQDDDLQPRVTLYMDARSFKTPIRSERPRIKIQTTISQRNLDVTE